jgi:hypothetical protein
MTPLTQFVKTITHGYSNTLIIRDDSCGNFIPKPQTTRRVDPLESAPRLHCRWDGASSVSNETIMILAPTFLKTRRFRTPHSSPDDGGSSQGKLAVRSGCDQDLKPGHCRWKQFTDNRKDISLSPICEQRKRRDSPPSNDRIIGVGDAICQCTMTIPTGTRQEKPKNSVARGA